MNRVSALLALHAAVLLFGFAGLFGKWLALSPIAIVLGRTAIAAATLGWIRALGPRQRGGFDGQAAANGVILALHWVAFFAAIQASSVAIGLLGYASFPLFVLVLERVLQGRRWSPAEGAAALAVAAGLAILVPDFSLGSRIVVGLGWGVLSGFTFALLTVRNRGLTAQRRPEDIALWQNVGAALCLVPLLGLPGALPETVGGRDVALLLVLGVICTALAHTLFIGSLRRVTAHTASVVAALEPVYGIALAALLQDEIPGPRTLAGGALIVGAAVYASTRDGRGGR